MFKKFQYALCKKFPTSEEHHHWLDAAKEKYDSKLVEDIKVLLRVFVLYLPLPIFWALFKQQVRIPTRPLFGRLVAGVKGEL